MASIMRQLSQFMTRRRRTGNGEAEDMQESSINEFSLVTPIRSSGSYSFQEPIARSGHRVFTDGEYLYTVGGYNPERVSPSYNGDSPDDFDANNDQNPLLLELWRLNLLTDEWELLDTNGFFPRQMASFAMTYDTYGGNLLIFGGTAIPFGSTASNELHSIKLKGQCALHWKQLNLSGTIPDHGYGQAFVETKDAEFYLIGGTSGYQYNMMVHRFSVFRKPLKTTVHQGDVEFFDGESSCTSMGLECAVRYRHEVLHHDDKILIFGGGTRELSYGFENLDAYDLKKNEYTKVGTMPDPLHDYPKPRRCHAVVMFRQNAYVIGGFDGTTLFDCVWRLDLSTAEPYQWQKFHVSLPKPLYFHSADVTPDGCVYVFGGVMDQNGTVRSKDVYRLWLEPPSLQTTALRALIIQTPTLLAKGKEELRRFGIPISLAQRLSKPTCPQPA